MKYLSRRNLLGVLGAATALAALLGAAPPALAQENFPSKPIRIVNNFPPGGPSDMLARSMQPVIQELLGQPLVVDSKAGAGGNLGAAEVARAAPDGHTLLMTIDTTLTINPHLYKSMPFQADDLTPVFIVASSGMLVGVRPADDIKSMADLIKAGKERTLNFSSASNGSPGHLAAAQLREATQVKVEHVPYRGNSAAVTAIVAGEVDGGILATPGMIGHVNTGKITPLAVTSARRSSLLPDLPTVQELGYAELEQEILYVVMAPRGTPAPIVEKLQASMLEAFKRPDVLQRVKGLDLHIEAQTGEEAAQRLEKASQRYARIVQATGMQVE